MNARTSVAAFSLAVGAVFAGAYGVGAVVGPIGDAAPVHAEAHTTDSEYDGDHGSVDEGSHHDDGAKPDSAHGDRHAASGADSAPAPGSTEIPGGLMIAQNGYSLVLGREVASPGRDRVVKFSVIGPDGAPVTQFDVAHEKRLHLIAVKRDFSGFQHVHPVLDGNGEWRIALDLQPGQWRLFADFTPTGGEAMTLGADLLVEGRVAARADEPETRTAHVDGYTVTLDGDLNSGAESKLTLSVSRSGRPVTDLEPYLGAYGHVVALREGDLAYLHVHPRGTPGDGQTEPGPDVIFYAAVPSVGDYHVYLDFKHDGVVRTAKFKLGTGPQDKAADSSAQPEVGEQDAHASNQAHSH